MEFYKRIVPTRLKKYAHYIVIFDDGSYATYDKQMKKIAHLTDRVWRTKIFSSFSLMMDENELCKLMLLLN